MKVRTNYVSNSSSSSFVIAYDEMFFGDLISFFKHNRDIMPIINIMMR